MMMMMVMMVIIIMMDDDDDDDDDEMDNDEEIYIFEKKINQTLFPMSALAFSLIKSLIDFDDLYSTMQEFTSIDDEERFVSSVSRFRLFDCRSFAF